MRNTDSWWVVLALAISGATLPALAAQQTSPETRAEMIRLIDTLEKHPNDPNAREMRGKVLSWLADAPDVTVTMCDKFLGIEKFNPDEAGGELVLQQPFAEAKFMLENPDKASDEMAVHLAGVEGALRTYAVMKAEDPKLVIPAMESLVKLQAQQKLPEYIAQAIEKCS